MDEKLRATEPLAGNLTPWLMAGLLGIAALGTNLLRVPLLTSETPMFLFGGVFVLLAFVCLGRGKGLLVALVATAPIDLLLTDVILPGMNGRQLRDTLVSRRPDLQVLYMSGYTGEVLSNNGALEPGTHLLPKPFSVQSLTHKVREVLDA